MEEFEQAAKYYNHEKEVIIDKNLKNRQAAIDNYHYGPANPDRAEGYWKDSARIFDVSEATAKTMPIMPTQPDACLPGRYKIYIL